MQEKSEQYRRFINSTLADAAAGEASAPRPATINMLVGSVAGDAIFIGDATPETLDAILRRRNGGRQRVEPSAEPK